MHAHAKRLAIAALVSTIGMAATDSLYARQRMVSVNGVWLGPAELAARGRPAAFGPRPDSQAKLPRVPWGTAQRTSFDLYL